MDISLAAQLMINESFPSTCTGNTNELSIKPPEKWDKAMALRCCRLLMEKGAEGTGRQLGYVQLL